MEIEFLGGKLQHIDTIECEYCEDINENFIIKSCGHAFCRFCLLTYLGSKTTSC